MMTTQKRSAISALALILISSPAFCLGTVSSGKSVLGVADWGSAYSGSVSSLVQGAQDSMKLGVQNLMIAMGPNYNTLDYTHMPGDLTSLTELAKSPAFTNVFNMPFTTYKIDASPLSVPNVLDSSDRHDEYRKTYNEFLELANHLLDTYAGSGKTFILSDWEGDSSFAEENALPGHPDTDREILLMKTWLRARDKAIADARAAHSATIGVTIKTATEFTSVDCARNGTHPCMLSDVIPYVKSDIISYSSYETINKGAINNNLTDQINSDISYIRNSPGVGSKPLIIGEFGFPQNFPAAKQSSSELTQTAAMAFLNNNIPLAFDWQIKDSGSQGVDAGLGLVSGDGCDTASWQVINSLVGGPLPPRSSLCSSTGAASPVSKRRVSSLPPAIRIPEPVGKPNPLLRVGAPSLTVTSTTPGYYKPLTASSLPPVNLPSNPSLLDVQRAAILGSGHVVGVTLQNE